MGSFLSRLGSWLALGTGLSVLGVAACSDGAGDAPSGVVGTDAGDATVAPSEDAAVDGGLPAAVVQDRAFGNDGRVLFDRGSSRDVATALAIQPDGKMLVAGTNDDAGNGRPLVMRVLPGGALDPGFAKAGKLLLPLGTSARIDRMVLGADGKIVLMAGGHIVRLLPDGSLDTSFGGTGRVDFPAVNALAIDATGRLVVATPDALLRLRADGTEDPTFREWRPQPAVQRVALDGAGRIFTINADYTDSALTRLMPDGAPDPAFAGGTSQSLVDLTFDRYLPGSLVPLGDGSVVLAYASHLRRIRPDGTVDTSITYEELDDRQGSFGDELHALADGSIVALGTAGIHVYASSGARTASIMGAKNAIAVAGGKILVADPGSTPAGNAIALHRYDASGVVDATFTSAVRSGASIDRGTAILRNAAGQLAVVGTASRSDAEGLGSSVTRITRFGATGMLDPALGGRPFELAEMPKDLALASDDRLVSVTSDRIFRRYLPDGSRDRSFGEDGSFAMTTRYPEVDELAAPLKVGGMRIDTADRIIVASGARVANIGARPWTELARILATGSPDPAFGVDGAALISGQAFDAPLAVQADEKIVVGVHGNNGYALGGALVVNRYDTSAAEDPSYDGIYFGSDGFVSGFVRLRHALSGRDGALTVTGIGQDGSFFAVRFGPNGGNDGTFHAIARPIDDAADMTPAAILLPDGRLLLAGSRLVDGQRDLLFQRYSTAGVLEAESVIPWGPGPDEVGAIELLPDGSLLATGTTWSPSTDADQFVARFVMP